MFFKKNGVCRSLVCLFTLLGGLSSLSVLGAKVSDKDSAKGKRLQTVEVPLDVADFGEGWKAKVEYPEAMGVVATECQLWVEDGWLHAARVSEVGVEWRIALANISAGMVPRAFQFEGRPAIKITYAEGKYFIRDNSVVVRALRPPFDKERPTFEVTDVLQNKTKSRGQCGSLASDFLISGRSDITSDEPWFYAMTGPSPEKLNTFVRLNPHELSKPRYGLGNMPDGQRRAFHGDCWAFDDGELLVAFYKNSRIAKLQLNAKKVKENMVNGKPPEIDGAEWFNAEKPISLSDLKGKVVLLDFWATTCGPCIKKLPEVQKLHDKYAGQGLVVIGIHMPETLGACEKFVKAHDYTFPFMLDSGKTAESYGVSANPTCFLIGREGKIVSGYDARLPATEMIEMLLKQ